MFRTIHLLFLHLFLCVCISVYSQTGNNSVLWKISGNGILEESFLFGTIHAVPGKQFTINDSVISNVKKAKALILELDTDLPISEMLKAAKRMILPAGTTIKNYLDSTQYNHLFLYMRDTLNIKEEKIQRYFTFKPVFLQSMILMEIIEKPQALDSEIKKIAGKKKNFIPLETIDEQFDMLDSIPIELQLDLDTNKFTFKEEYFNLLELYSNQDLDGIDSLMFSDPDFKKIEYNLLTKRNRNWMPIIEQSIKKESSFIAVGCGHLIGEDGLIKLLQDKGYILEPILFNQ
jgi:uncharacterized protein YbaP (TraB family)